MRHGGRSPLRPVPVAPPTQASALPESTSVRWFKAEEDLSDELVLSGQTAVAIAKLAAELRHTDEFLRAKLDPSTRVLFSGPSGTGKTLGARWLGWTLKLPVAVVDVSQVVGSYLGETSKNLSECFRIAAAVPSILFLDEIDAVCRRRDERSAYAVELARATTTFLQQLDWLRPNRIVVAATNFPDDLDSALRRRLTTEVVFGFPDRDARSRMLGRWLERVRLPGEMVTSLLDATEGVSGADLRARAMAIARASVMERLPKAVPEPPPAPLKNVRELAQELLLNLEAMGDKR